MPKITEEKTLKVAPYKPSYNTLTFECEHIYLHQTSIDLKIEVPTEKIEQFDYIVINGIKFKKDNGEYYAKTRHKENQA